MNARQLLSIDVRSLALLRIGMAVTILVDLAIRAADLRVFYTDQGVVPRAALLSQAFRPGAWSLHLLIDSVAGLYVVWLLAALLALALLAGYFTRWATIGSWILLTSLHARNPLIVQGGDILLRQLLFWGMFLPLGARWSLDRRAARSSGPLPSSVFSLGTIGLLGQIVLMYFFSVLMKSKHFYLVQAQAIFFVLQVDLLRQPFGTWLLGQPALMRWLTRSVFVLQALGPWLMFSPWRTGMLRTILVLVFIGWHFGMSQAIALGPFPWVNMVAMTAFLPTWFWEQAPIRRSLSAPIRLTGRLIGPWTYYLPTSPSLRLGLPSWASILAGFSLLYVVWWNLGVMGIHVPLPRLVQQAGYGLRLDQVWSIMTKPGAADGWYVMPGRLASGQVVDISRNGQPLAWQKPDNLYLTNPNERWRKYQTNLWSPRNRLWVPYYIGYLCRQWNEGHQGGERLVGLSIVYMQERVLRDGTALPVRPVTLGRQRCV